MSAKTSPDNRVLRCLAMAGVVAVVGTSCLVLTSAAAASPQFLESWGYTPYSDGKFVSPRGAAIGQGEDVYVTDSDSSTWARIERFGSDGAFKSTFGAVGTSAGQLKNPVALATDGSGNVYVAEYGNNRVSKFTASGTFLRAWGKDVGGSGVDVCTSTCQAGTDSSSSGGFSSPGGVAVSGSVVYVTDTSRVQRFDTSGTFLSQWGSSGSAEGQFQGLLAIAISEASGDVYVADATAQRVQQFTSAGSFTRMWGWGVDDGTVAFQICTSVCQAGIAGAGAGQLDTPSGIHVSQSSTIAVTEEANNRVDVFGTTGTFSTALGYGVSDGSAVLQTCTAVCQAGVAGSADGQFNGPLGIVTGSSSQAYVVDANNKRVEEFDALGAFVRTWGSFRGDGAGEIGTPQGIDTDPAGNLYMADVTNNRVTKYSNSGTYLATFGSAGSGPGQVTSPRDVVIGSDGSVYVADQGNARIDKFDASGAFLTSWGSAGGGDGQFSGLIAIATDANDSVYTLETGNARVQKFTAQGSFVTKWGSPGTGPGQFDTATGLAASADGTVFVTDSVLDRVQVFTSVGGLTGSWGTTGSGPGQLNAPLGIEVADNGQVWIADLGNGRLQQFSSSGAYLDQVGSPGHGDGQFSSATGVALDCRGNVFASDMGNAARIEKFGDSSLPSPPCTSSEGGGGSGDGGSGGGGTATALTVKIRMHPSRFRTKAKRSKHKRSAKHSKRKKRRKRKTGTKLTYTLSKPAKVRFTVQKPVKGRTVKGRCKTKTKKRKKRRSKGKRCTTYKSVGSFSYSGEAGANSKTFKGKVGRRRLRPGAYRLAAVATDEVGAQARARSVVFRVLR